MLTCGILLIGNELLSGRTQDTNLAYMAPRLKDQGIKLCEVRIIPDDEAVIINTVNTLRAHYTYVLTTGGIGATHDDITALSISKAFDIPYVLHPHAHQCLRDFYGDSLNDIRLKMAYMPDKAQLIHNPISGAPGFFIENVYSMAGMPKVMRAMFDYILPTLQQGKPFLSQSITSNLLEGEIATHLEAIQQNHPHLTIGSYPFYNSDTDRGATFVVQGQDEHLITCAVTAIKEMIRQYQGIIA